MASNSFSASGQLSVDDRTYEIYRIDRVKGSGRLPYSLKVLLENLLRNEDGRLVTAEQITALGDWNPQAETNAEIQYTPARVLMQDFIAIRSTWNISPGWFSPGKAPQVCRPTRTPWWAPTRTGLRLHHLHR
jgi:aconitase A